MKRVKNSNLFFVKGDMAGILATIILLTLFFVGCGEEEEPTTVMTEAPEGVTDTLGSMKVPVMAAPPAPGVPFVKAVGFYKDWRRRKPITEAQVGDLVYVQVTFSEAMQVTPADDKTARPVIFFKEDKQLTRFHVAAKRSKGKDFAPGDIKPVKTASTFLGKYTVQEDVTRLTIAVGKQTTDLQGTPLSSFYTHKERLQIRQPDTTPPEVVSVSYYTDETLTEPLTDTVHSGDTIYTKIVFSEVVRVTVADDRSGRPALHYQVGGKLTRFRIISEGARLTSGSARPLGDRSAYLGMYTVTDNNLHQYFTVAVGKHNADLQGNQLGQTYTHREELRIVERLAAPEVSAAGPVAVLYGAPDEPFSRQELRMVVGGEGITHYKRAYTHEDQCSDAVHQRDDVYSISSPIRVSYSGSPEKGWTTTLCVVGRDAHGVWQETPTAHRLVYDPAAVDVLPQATYTFTAEDRRTYPRILEGHINLGWIVRREQRVLTTQDYAEEFGVAFPHADIVRSKIQASSLVRALIPDYDQRFEDDGWYGWVLYLELLRLWVANPESSNSEILALFAERVEEGVLFALKDAIDLRTHTLSF